MENPAKCAIKSTFCRIFAVQSLFFRVATATHGTASAVAATGGFSFFAIVNQTGYDAAGY
jgi:hypothetical protein